MDAFTVNRRELLKLLGAFGAGSALAAAGLPVLARPGKARVAVVGGGFGGATAAKYLKRVAPELDVTLVEPAERFYTCPFTNLYLGGMIDDLETLGHGYDELKGRYGVTVVQQRADDVDVEGRRLRLADGTTLKWDRLILSPGIDFRWGELEGYDAAAAETVPHAWKAGPQTRLLHQQLRAMPDGGTYILAVPPAPFRCPPGPYERVSQVAAYFKAEKPRSKILLLDANDGFSKQGLFMEGWREHYGDMIEWVGRADDGTVLRVDAERRRVETEFGEVHEASVLNVVPPQKAGAIAERAGVADETGWVPIEPRTFESRRVPGVYVIGDATEAAPMPKSGIIANNQAKVTARAVVADLAGEAPPEPKWINTCYSVIAPEWGITVANVFEVADGELREVPGSGTVSPTEADPRIRRREAEFAKAWYAAVAQDTWGTAPRF